MFGLLNVVKEVCLWKDREVILIIGKTGNLKLILSPGVMSGEQWKTDIINSQHCIIIV